MGVCVLEQLTFFIRLNMEMHRSFQLHPIYLSIRLYKIRPPLRNRIHQTCQIPPHLQRKHACVHNSQITRSVHYHPLIHYSAFCPWSHGACSYRVVFATEAVPYESLYVILIEFVETGLEGISSIFEVRA